MKFTKFILPTALLLGALASCGGGNNGGNGDNPDKPNPDQPVQPVEKKYKFKNLELSVNDKYDYDFSFKTDKTDDEDVKYYVSSNSKLDSNDTEVEVGGENEGKFVYDKDMLDFYLLMVGKDNAIYAKQNIIIPTFIAHVNPGNPGQDRIVFEFMENGLPVDVMFDEGGINIYSTAEKSTDISKATLLKEAITIANPIDVPAKEENKYYFFEVYNGGGKVLFTSQVFERDNRFSHSTINDVSLIDNNGAPTLKVDATIEEGVEARLALYSREDTSIEPVLFENNTASIDLTPLSLPDADYVAYIMYGASIFETIYSKHCGDIGQSVITEDRIFTFNTGRTDVRVMYQDKTAFNITDAKFVLGEGEEQSKTFFVCSGLYDPSLIEIPVVDPMLFIGNSQDGNDFSVFPLTVNDETKTFTVKADLTTLKKPGPWYDVKIMLDSTTCVWDKETNKATVLPEDGYIELQVRDANDFNQTALNKTTNCNYLFKEWGGNLKIMVENLNNKITSWEYSRENGKVYLNLTGRTTTEGTSYIKIFRGNLEEAEAENRVIVGEINKDENNLFALKLDVTNIDEGQNYHVYWIFADGGKIEVTNKEMELPTSVVSSDDGFIYCTKRESWGDTVWYKVFKDRDVCKANQIKFLDKDGKPTVSVTGAINSSVITKDLYLQAALTDGTDAHYAKITWDENLNFTAEMDLSFITDKTAKYELKVVEKVDGAYADIPSGWQPYTGFYNEYLPTHYENEMITLNGTTYRTFDFRGEEDRWTVYVYIE